MLRAFLPVLLATLLAAGLGVGARRLLGPPSAAPPAETATTAEKAALSHGAPAPPDKSGEAHGKAAEPQAKGAGPATVSGIVPLPPIVGPLRAPDHIWVRFEGVIVVDAMDVTRAKTLAAEISDDTLVYFSTLSLSEIEGASGLKAVREDLSERAHIRGEGKLRELLIQTLVTQ